MKPLYAVALVALLTVLAVPSGLDSCGIGPPEPVFVTRRRPADLRAAFLKGRIGVIRGGFETKFLISAFRMASGIPLSEKEADSIAQGRSSADQSPLAQWLAARKQVPGASNSYPNPDRTRYREGGAYLGSYNNCLDGAFASARSTLEDRASRWGARSPLLSEWAAAQDQVFINCSAKEARIPNEPAANTDPLLAQDRRYQIAAAHFYAEHWREARDAFHKIEEDATSPWHGIAPYLIARSFIREATLDGKPEALVQAKQQLEAIMSDPARVKLHPSCARLLDFVNIRLNPAARLQQLEAAILQPGGVPDFGQAAIDIEHLLGQDLESSDGAYAWVRAISRYASPDIGAGAVRSWRTTHNKAWLIAALRVAPEADVSELVEAARGIPRTDAIYESLAFYGVQRLAHMGRKDEARRWAEEALARPMDVSSRNLILGERMSLARNWSEMLRFALRRPEPRFQTFDNRESEEAQAPGGTGPSLDEDAARIMVTRTPLSLWIDAARSASLPAPVQLGIATGGWLRAVLLDQYGAGTQFLKRVVELQPAVENTAQDYLAAPDPAAARFAAVFVLLHSPDIQPSPYSRQDLARPSSRGAGRWYIDQYYGGEGPPTARETEFLTPAQIEEGSKEYQQLKSLPRGATWLGAQTLARARAHPDDPRLPEALHLVVQASHRGLTDEATGKYSKEAFDILHKRHPKSPWTAKTPYWYK